MPRKPGTRCRKSGDHAITLSTFHTNLQAPELNAEENLLTMPNCLHVLGFYFVYKYIAHSTYAVEFVGFAISHKDSTIWGSGYTRRTEQHGGTLASETTV